MEQSKGHYWEELK